MACYNLKKSTQLHGKLNYCFKIAYLSFTFSMSNKRWAYKTKKSGISEIILNITSLVFSNNKNHTGNLILWSNPWRHFHIQQIIKNDQKDYQLIMLLTAPDCFFSSSMLFSMVPLKPTTTAGLRLNSLSRNRECKACLITSPDSFEVGRLIGSYGFMNITRFVLFNLCILFCGLILIWYITYAIVIFSYSGFQDVEYSSGDLERLRVQDVGEGSVKIRCIYF